MMSRRLGAIAVAGLFAGAAAWALHQQLGIVLASWSCTHAPDGIRASGLAAAAVLVAGAILSGLALRRVGHTGNDFARPRSFIAQVSLMAAALFAFAVILQVCATFFLPGCGG